MDWSGVDCLSIIVMFISCLDSHSDGTHSLQSIHWWASDVQLHFSRSVLMKKQNKLAQLMIIFEWSTGSRKEYNRSGAQTITDLKRVSYFWVPNGWIKTTTDQNQLWIKLKEKKMCISSTYRLRKPSNGRSRAAGTSYATGKRTWKKAAR